VAHLDLVEGSIDLAFQGAKEAAQFPLVLHVEH
jgi:hypothetical protein